MNRPILIAGLLAVLFASSAFAQSNPLDQTPSPTVVYSDLVTVGGAPLVAEASDTTVSGTSIFR